ncbi:MAG: MATE family efflux transporter [Bacteroidales bacterium]|nr:MATE family efflux transporter [Bacteroidales bacterium]
MNLSVSHKEIWQITHPIIFGNLAQTLIVLVNTIFLGHVGAAELGAAMMAGLYYLVFTTITQGFSVGIQIMVARRLGEGNIGRIGKIFEHGLYFSLLLGVLLLGLLNLFTKTLFAHIIESPNIYASALRFLDFRQWGIIFVSVNFLFRALYVGLSNTKIISITTLMMAGVNIFFDYALIFGHFGFPEMGVAGAGLSSVLAEITAFITFFAYTFIKLPYKNYNLFTFEKFDGGLLKSVLRISLPTMFQRLVSFGSWFLFFAMIEHLGEEEMAISGIVRSVYMLCTLSVFAFGTTANTVTSRLIGAGKTDEIPQTLRRILKMSLLILLPILVFFVLFPQQIASIYTDDAALALKSVPVLYTIYVGAVVMAAAMIYFEFVSGTGNTFLALVMETGVLVFYIVYIYLATQVFCFPIRWVWCSEWVYSVLMLVASLVFMKVHPWREKTGVAV